MESSEKSKKKIRYWLIWLITLLALFFAVAGLVFWIQNTQKQEALKEPRDFPSEVELKNTWDLSVMYKDMAEAQTAYKELSDQIHTFESYKNHLNETATYKKAVQLHETLLITEEKLRIYASLKRDIALEDGDATNFLSQVDQLDTQLTEGLAFFKPELSRLSEEKLNTYLSLSESKSYTKMLQEIIEDRQSFRSESEDRLLGLLGELNLTYENNYQAFWNRYDVTLKNNAYDNYFSKDDDKRFEATQASLQKQIDAVEVLASNLEGKVKYDNLTSTAYGYDSDLEMVLSQDSIELKDYLAYEKINEKNLKLLHRWITIKQKILGLERPYQFHDNQLPIMKNERTFKYDKAVLTAREAFKPLGDEYLQIYDEATKNRWIDVYPREGKYTGSYTWGAYASHPYVLLNYEDDFVSAETFAHEMGHAVHTYMSSKNQGFNTYENSIFKAEIASTANEVLFLENQLTLQKSEGRQEVLIQYIDLIVGTIFEQMKASEFEKLIHAAQTNGKDLDGDFLKKTWQELNAKYYGPNYKVTELDGYGWTEIDHLYWNFYMYKYATGLASGFTIAEQLLDPSKDIKTDYIKFLKSGNTMDILVELKGLNVNLEDGNALEACYQKLSKLLDELEVINQ